MERPSLRSSNLLIITGPLRPHMLPLYRRDGPLSLVRCPEGSEKPCFYQKHANNTLPPNIEAVDVPDKKTGKTERYITLSTAEALAGLAQMGVLEVHPWGSRNDDLEHPDRIIFDLDPDTEIPWTRLAESAAEVRKQLKKLGLESFLKSTGGKGLHVVVPFVAEYDWSVIKQFAHAFVLQMERESPGLYLTKMSKARAKAGSSWTICGTSGGATAVAAFSPRARAGVCGFATVELGRSQVAGAACCSRCRLCGVEGPVESRFVEAASQVVAAY